MRIASPLPVQRTPYYGVWYAMPPRAIEVRTREERRRAATLPPQFTGDAAQLTLLMAQAMREPRPIDADVARAAYTAVLRDDESILISVDA